jgi:hypothetical protein
MTSIDGVGSGVSTNSTTSTGGATDWFEALAIAWGATLDAQAQNITNLSNQLGAGTNNPSALTMLTAASQEMSFMANSESTSINAVGDGLSTVARKE